MILFAPIQRIVSSSYISSKLHPLLEPKTEAPCSVVPQPLLTDQCPEIHNAFMVILIPNKHLFSKSCSAVSKKLKLNYIENPTYKKV